MSRMETKFSKASGATVPAAVLLPSSASTLNRYYVTVVNESARFVYVILDTMLLLPLAATSQSGSLEAKSVDVTGSLYGGNLTLSGSHAHAHLNTDSAVVEPVVVLDTCTRTRFYVPPHDRKEDISVTVPAGVRPRISLYASGMCRVKSDNSSRDTTSTESSSLSPNPAAARLSKTTSFSLTPTPAKSSASTVEQQLKAEAKLDDDRAIRLASQVPRSAVVKHDVTTARSDSFSSESGTMMIVTGLEIEHTRMTFTVGQSIFDVKRCESNRQSDRNQVLQAYREISQWRTMAPEWEISEDLRRKYELYAQTISGYVDNSSTICVVFTPGRKCKRDGNLVVHRLVLDGTTYKIESLVMNGLTRREEWFIDHKQEIAYGWTARMAPTGPRRVLVHSKCPSIDKIVGEMTIEVQSGIPTISTQFGSGLILMLVDSGIFSCGAMCLYMNYGTSTKPGIHRFVFDTPRANWFGPAMSRDRMLLPATQQR